MDLRDSNPRPLQCDGYKYRGKWEKWRLLRLICTKITIQLAALLACCFSITVPEGYRSLKQGKAIRINCFILAQVGFLCTRWGVIQYKYHRGEWWVAVSAILSIQIDNNIYMIYTSICIIHIEEELCATITNREKASAVASLSVFLTLFSHDCCSNSPKNLHMVMS